MFNYRSPQPAMSQEHSSCVSMRKSRLLLLLASLFCLCQGALAQEDNREAYAVLDDEGQLKFYYDTNKPSSGTVYDIPWDSSDQYDKSDPGWVTYDQDNYEYIENTEITSVAFDASFSDYRLESARGMFAGCTALTDIDFTNFNTSYVTDMYSMFYGCSSLTALDLRSFNTANVTRMTRMFYGCSNLQQLDLGSFNTANVTRMTRMFYGCSNLQQLDLRSFNTANVTDMYKMFSDCSSLQQLDLRSFNTSGVTNMSNMFYRCSSLKQLDLSSFNTASVTNMSWMFYGCSSLQQLDLSSFNTANVTDMFDMFYGCSGLQQLDLSNFNTANVNDMSWMFTDCSSLTYIYCDDDWSSIPRSENFTSRNMFSRCTNLPYYSQTNANDISFAKLTSEGGYFTTHGLPYAVLSDGTLTFYYDTSKETRQGTVYDIPWEGNLPGWCNPEGDNDISNVVFDESFDDYHGLTSTKGMFATLEQLTAITHIEYLHTENVTDMTGMFLVCGGLESLDLTNFNIGKVANVSNMFGSCYSLETIFCNSDFNNGQVNSDNGNSVFLGCTKLKGAIEYYYTNIDYTFANPTSGYFTYALKDNAYNSSLISSTSSMPRVGLVGRTLYKDGDWNTLCLPFDLTTEQLSASPLAGFSELRTLSEALFSEATGTLTLNFTPAEGKGAVTAIEAGKPYIIKWANTGETIEDPIFTSVSLGNSTLKSVETDVVSFMGNYDPRPITEATPDILFLGAGNTLYHPDAAMTINAFRAYFELNLPSSQQVNAFQLNFGEEETGIKEITTDSNPSTPSNSYFTLDGRKLDGKPSSPGLYVHNGRKVLIK